jgi:hypothetical protein
MKSMIGVQLKFDQQKVVLSAATDPIGTGVQDYAVSRFIITFKRENDQQEHCHEREEKWLFHQERIRLYQDK